MLVTVTLDGSAGAVVAQARLDRAAASVAEGTAGRVVYARLVQGAQALRPGDFVTARIAEPALSDAAIIPAAALGSDGGVLVAGADGRLQATPVTVLRRQGDEVALAIAAVRSEASVLPRNRKLSVRFHLPEGTIPAAGDFKSIPSHASRAADLFAGAEAPATDGEGPVVLIRAEMDPSQPLTVRLATKAG